jgi:glutathione S-transferase
LGLDYVAHVVTPDAPLARQKLIRSGGKDQIPFMIDHRTGIKLYESQAILKYLDHEYGPKFENAIERLVHEVDQRTRTELEQLKWRLKIPAERLREYRATLREGVDTLRGTAKLIREAFRQALAYPGDVDTAGATVGERVAAAKRAA